MKLVKGFPLAGIIVLITAVFAAGQTESDLKQFFEGRRVILKIDMPATKDGVGVYPERRQPIDYSRYANSLKSNGIGIREGDSVMITKIKVKDKHVEFQLGGGGYGTFWDETSSSVYVPSTGKSRREKELERALKNETDERRRRRLRDELSYLRREREHEDRQNRAEAAIAEEIAKQRIQEKRLQGGSRFNISFDRKVTVEDLTPRAIMDALAQYVDFDEIEEE